MRGVAGDHAALEDMLRYGSLVQAHTSAGRASIADQLSLHGVLWELAVIGESANRVSRETRDAHPEVPWQKIIAQRNILVHVYDEIDVDLLWRAVVALPDLQGQVKVILEELGEP